MRIKRNSTYIIAEIGINHEGNFARAKKLVNLAKKSGVDAVKFQVFKPETMAQKVSKKTDLQKKSTNQKESLYNMWKRVELKENELRKLKILTKKLSLDFICSAFDEESLHIVKKLKPAAIKIASSDINDVELLKEAKKLKLPVIISTGMATQKDISKAIKLFQKQNSFFLHCVSMYPVPENFINLNRMMSIKNRYKVNVGYSDHSNNFHAAFASVSLGAQILEKHFTDNKKRIGADHSLSADFREMKSIVEFSKKISILRGNGLIEPTKKEAAYKKYFRKGIYASREIKKGEKFSKNNIIKRRPENSSEIQKYLGLIGKKSKFNYKPKDTIKIK